MGDEEEGCSDQKPQPRQANRGQRTCLPLSHSRACPPWDDPGASGTRPCAGCELGAMGCCARKEFCSAASYRILESRLNECAFLMRREGWKGWTNDVPVHSRCRRAGRLLPPAAPPHLSSRSRGVSSLGQGFPPGTWRTAALGTCCRRWPGARLSPEVGEAVSLSLTASGRAPR